MSHRIVQLVIAAGVLLAPGLAHAHVFQFCMKYSVVATDSNVGEDFFPVVSSTGHPWPAVGAKVRVKDPITLQWSTPINTSDTDGCFRYISNANTGFQIELTSEHRFAGNGGDVVVQVKDDYPGALKVWVVNANPGVNGGTFSYNIPPSNETNLSAIAAWTVARVNLAMGRTMDPETLVVYDADLNDLNGTWDGSGFVYWNEEIAISDTKSHSFRKFLVAHEIGHFIVRRWALGVDSEASGYAVDDVGTLCEFSGLGAHAMRSAEASTSAWKEGIAHFISAFAFNDETQTDGFFKYYKTGGLYSNETIPLDVAGSWTFDWFDAECTQTAGRSVEQDWMRHYWNFLTDAGTKPTMADLALHCDELHQDPLWSASNVFTILDTVWSLAGLNTFETRWDNLAAVHGISGV